MRKFYLLLILLPALLIGSCSSSNTVTPEDSFVAISDEVMQDWGNYSLMFDPETQDVEVVYERDSANHFEISSFLNPPACSGAGCITATLVAWNPVTFIAKFNVTITNPSAWTPSDIRLIFYNLGGKDIANADSYTNAYVGSVEPFIAFAKAIPNRQFAGGGAVTETVDIYWPPASSFFTFFKVSAWLWLNCRDPYEINSMFQSGTLTTSGGSATIGCNVFDWQNNVTGVTIDTTPITGGVTNLVNVVLNMWQANITNSAGAPTGNYKCLITASSPNPQNFDLYNYVVIQVSPPGWGPGSSFDLPPGPCTMDFGVIANNPPGHILLTHPDATGACNEIWKYPGWANLPAFYASLVNLDLLNPLFQPWPVVRLDAANHGAFGWTNEDSTTWLPDPFFIAGVNTYCNFDKTPAFIWNPEPDDHRHFMIDPQFELPLWPIDCCDTFNCHQCALYVDLGFGLAGFQGIPGELQGFDYTDRDIVWEALFPLMFIGDDNGQIDPGDVVGIDCRVDPDDPTVIWVYIAQRVHAKVEVFKITDIGPGPFDVVTHIMTIWTSDMTGVQIEPIDIELLPGNDMYDKAPGIPILCVVFDNAAFPFPSPGFGGSVTIYDAISGAFLEQIGDSLNPAVQNTPVFLDTDDSAYAIHVMQQGPIVTQFDYS